MRDIIKDGESAYWIPPYYYKERDEKERKCYTCGKKMCKKRYKCVCWVHCNEWVKK